MFASRFSGFGGGGVGQKFKPLLGKLVSDWVSSIANKLTILVLRIARAKSEALYNFYSLFKQNIKSCNAK